MSRPPLLHAGAGAGSLVLEPPVLEPPVLEPPLRLAPGRGPWHGAQPGSPPPGGAGDPHTGAAAPPRAGARRRRGRERADSFAGRHALSLPIVGGLLLIAAFVLGAGITHYPGFSDDEGTYVAQAWAVLTQGSLAHYTYWYDHPPLGWLQLALLMRLAGPLLTAPGAVAAARSLMLVPALASTCLLYALGRRLQVGRAFAAVAVLLFVLCPLSVTLVRQVYLDNLATPWLLGAFVLGATPSRRLWAFAASGACFAVAVLTKETALLALPGLALLVLQRVDRRTRPFCLTAFGLSLGLIVLGYPLYALLKGELLPGRGHVSLLEAVTFQLYRRPGTGDPLSATSASHQLIAGWLHTDPWLLLVGLALVPAAFAVRRLRPVALTLTVLAITPLHGGYLPQPFVIELLPFCALTIAGTADALWKGAAGRTGRARWLRVCVLAAAAAAFVALAGPRWQRGDAYATSAVQTTPQYAAEHWIAAHVDRRARLLVDDTYYVDLVRMGFAQRFGVVWFYKMDFTTNLDPSIVRHLPQGWRAFDYIVSTPVIRAALAQTPGGLDQVRLMLANSHPVASFGTGSERVEVRRVVGVGVGSGLIPRAAVPLHRALRVRRASRITRRRVRAHAGAAASARAGSQARRSPARTVRR